MKTITPRDLVMLSAEARGSVRKRKNLNLHPTLADPVQRMLNAFEPGTYLRPHRHADKWELFALLAGRALVLSFDQNGAVQERHELSDTGTVVAEIPAGVWHTLAALDASTVLLEVKQGPYIPNNPQDFAPWAPSEGDTAAARLEAWFHVACVGDRAPC